jgi:hypothetical protein
MNINFEFLETQCFQTKQKTLLMYLEQIEEYIANDAYQPLIENLRSEIEAMVDPMDMAHIYISMRTYYRMAIHWNRFDLGASEAHRKFNTALVVKRRKERINSILDD